jgi:hypothetical protein
MKAGVSVRNRARLCCCLLLPLPPRLLWRRRGMLRAVGNRAPTRQPSVPPARLFQGRVPTGSRTVTAKVAVAWLPEASVAVQVTCESGMGRGGGGGSEGLRRGCERDRRGLGCCLGSMPGRVTRKRDGEAICDGAGRAGAVAGQRAHRVGHAGLEGGARGRAVGDGDGRQQVGGRALRSGGAGCWGSGLLGERVVGGAGYWGRGHERFVCGQLRSIRRTLGDR